MFSKNLGGLLYFFQEFLNAFTRFILIYLHLQQFIRQAQSYEGKRYFLALGTIGPRFVFRKPIFKYLGRPYGPLHIGPWPKGYIQTQHGKVIRLLFHRIFYPVQSKSLTF